MLALKLKIFTWLVTLQTFFCGCHADRRHGDFARNRGTYVHTRIGRLAPEIPESSGLAVWNDSLLLTHNDSGNGPDLFVISHTGALQDRFALEVPNKDWEELTRDTRGRTYVGDTGNNRNQRQDLAIHVLDEATRTLQGSIRFRYPDQTAFPPPGDSLNFDCEAFFAWQDSLYLFSKNRGKGPVKLYRLPQTPGEYVAELVDTHPIKGLITAADVSPDGQRFALLSYGMIYLFDIAHGTINFDQPRQCLRFPNAGQSESLVFLTPTDFLVGNEQGRLFHWCRKDAADRP
ncbi:hypothetical protein SAMN05421823_104375 [Catalinimonas alkaloidigena]|uniref:Uncharacterized protein n=1 Tax=Catalinimonas alkaloidigena TaxID=1075417 RepID=A0A1G9HAU3_9BACT|nr:hypothetical protein [Catalinimonas alkaloidigena]SDL10027.1 hypothetical protein SAMN05421823_104375 [Catalinimonas alkaloidigena]